MATQGHVRASLAWSTCKVVQCRAKSWGLDDLFHVRFGFDRTPFRRMHSALAAAAQSPVLRLLPVDGTADAAEPQNQVRIASQIHQGRCSAMCVH